ncbi:MAG TPA: hypothetical protein VFY48_07830 [Solirubrobacterales bacterium]|nr:hypothetical protein [Solirubrobacterales bacterium]
MEEDAPMMISEQAVFRWVVIVGVAAASVIALTLLTRPLFGALWGLVLAIAAGVHAWRWFARKRHEF